MAEGEGMHEVTFRLQISAAELMRYYRGEAQVVVVQGENGLRLQLPAGVLRPFVGEDGIRGRFVIRYTEGGKLGSLRRLSAA